MDQMENWCKKQAQALIKLMIQMLNNNSWVRETNKIRLLQLLQLQEVRERNKPIQLMSMNFKDLLKHKVILNLKQQKRLEEVVEQKLILLVLVPINIMQEQFEQDLLIIDNKISKIKVN